LSDFDDRKLVTLSVPRQNFPSWHRPLAERGPEAEAGWLSIINGRLMQYGIRRF
jgi:hypothetical protein